jgi:AcrR family transcriptional regulator
VPSRRNVVRLRYFSPSRARSGDVFALVYTVRLHCRHTPYILSNARLDQQKILDAALAVADRDGVEALAVRRVARELAVTPMALYRYVDGREGLVDALSEALFTRLELPGMDQASWQDELRMLARSFRRLVQDHPAAVAIMASGGEGENERRVCDAMLSAFRRAGFDDETAERLYRQFTHFVLALVTQDERGFELGLKLFLAGAKALRLELVAQSH